MGAWLLAHQLWFVHALEATMAGLDVDQSVTPTHLAPDQAATARLTVTSDQPLAVPISVEAAPPITAVGSTEADRTVALERTDTHAATTFPLEWPVTGAFAFECISVVGQLNAVAGQDPSSSNGSEVSLSVFPFESVASTVAV